MVSPTQFSIVLMASLPLFTSADAAQKQDKAADVAAQAAAVAKPKKGKARDASTRTAAALTPKKVAVGDGTIDGKRIRPFEYQRQQCARDEKGWRYTGALLERATETGEGDDKRLQLEHEATQPDGTHVHTVMLYDRDTLAPVQISTAMKNEARGRSGSIDYRLTPQGYTGERVRGEQKRPLSGSINSNMYNGITLGLVLAAADLKHDLPLELPASMLSFDASYRVIATFAGTRSLTLAGQPVEATLVDVEWHHLEEGEVYPPGPDASGGRYWIVPDPPPGLPYVARYQTDSYVVEFERRTCPPSAQDISPS